MVTIKNFSKMSLVKFLVFLLLNANFSIAQIEFEKSYGGYSYDGGIGITNTSDGGYLVSGYTSTFTSDYDMYLVKLNFFGHVEWSKVYHSYGYDDKLQEVKEIPSGGYYAVGFMDGGFGANDYVILKVDAVGDIVWAKHSGGYLSDIARGVSITNDGGIIVSGFNASFGVGGVKDVQLIKFSSIGNVEWAKTYGGYFEEFNATSTVTQDGNYLIFGDTDISGFYDIRPLLIKTDTTGNIIWAKVYGGYSEDWARFGDKTIDGGFIISGDTKSYGLGGSQDIYLIKTDSSGNVEWAKAYGGLGDESGYCVLQNYEGKYVIAGYTNSFGFGGNDAFLMQVNVDGVLDWFHTYGGQQSDYAFWLKQTPDSGYVLSGRRSSNSLGSDDVYVLKTDKNGITSCEISTPNVNTFNIVNLQSSDYTLSIGNIISISDLTLNVIAVNSATKIYCETVPVELTSFAGELINGNVQLRWSTASEINNMGFNVIRDRDEIGFVAGSGTTTEPREYYFIDEDVKSGTYLYELIQVDYDGISNKAAELEVVVENVPSQYFLEQNYPNPFNPTTKIRYSIPREGHALIVIYDFLGQEVKKLVNEFKKPGYYELEFDGQGLPSGIYFYTILSEGFADTKKMLLVK